ncbi:MAG: hypothetical protein ACK521_06835 [bacterium]
MICAKQSQHLNNKGSDSSRVSRRELIENYTITKHSPQDHDLALNKASG